MKLQKFRVFSLFPNSELWRLEAGLHSSSASSILTAETSGDFSFLCFCLFFLTFLPASVPLIQIQHLGVSGGAFLHVAVCWFDLCLGCVKQTGKHTRSPPAAPPLMQFSTMWEINSECWHLPHSFGRQRQTESTVSVPPPQPNQVTSHFPAVSERASDGTRPNRPDGCFSSYLFMCLFLPPFLPLPPSETKTVLSRYIRCDLCAPRPPAAPLDQKQTRIPHKLCNS